MPSLDTLRRKLDHWRCRYCFDIKEKNLIDILVRDEDIVSIYQAIDPCWMYKPNWNM